MKTWILAISIALPATAQATGMYQCEPVDAENWLTEEQLTERITADGWTVSRMKQDGGCWEVYGSMPDGKRVEAYFHPSTGEVRLINQRGTILYRAEN
ncbi:PepSY domain-containing protein [Ruegeria sp. HKCCC2117]|uniref:PepSY domain-containing protein n=1 Tax=Ruegeria sp. HKCCC2117 TaxID=2682992 RepID=UPI001489E50A|nr:PepSY domain-containing protein [Ruegeria sp. HKCCC2117]